MTPKQPMRYGSKTLINCFGGLTGQAKYAVACDDQSEWRDTKRQRHENPARDLTVDHLHRFNTAKPLVNTR